jgi:hypothetical protein
MLDRLETKYAATAGVAPALASLPGGSAAVETMGISSPLLQYMEKNKVRHIRTNTHIHTYIHTYIQNTPSTQYLLCKMDRGNLVTKFSHKVGPK